MNGPLNLDGVIGRNQRSEGAARNICQRPSYRTSKFTPIGTDSIDYSFCHGQWRRLKTVHMILMAIAADELPFCGTRIPLCHRCRAPNYFASSLTAIGGLVSSYPSIRRMISISDLISAIIVSRFLPALIDASALRAGSETASKPYPPHAPRS